MNSPRRTPCLRILAAALLALAAGACNSTSNSANNSTNSSAPAQQNTGGTAERIAAEIGDAACDNSQQCRTLAYGHKACGGPERYVAWSAKRSDEARLTQLGKELAEQRRRQDERDGMMSTCSVTLDPGAVCEAGRCVLRPQSPGGAPLAR